MKTETTDVTQTIQIWAIPASAWRIENYPDDPPFTYAVRTDKPYSDGCVMVFETEITLTVPEGIDLVQAAVATLNEAINEVNAQAAVSVADLREKIKGLQLLEYKPEPDLSVVE